MQIDILKEGEDYAVINKPSGISVHADGKIEEYTISNFLVEKFPQAKNVGEPIVLKDGKQIERPGIIHRLDKETSGVLIIAKTQKGFLHFKNEFKERKVMKTYIAFTYGSFKEERGLIDLPIGRSISSIRKWATGKSARGELREAQTRYKVIKAEGGVSLLMLWPKTGRTHQIRVHLSALGHPLISDSLYAPKRPSFLGFDRLALHAHVLEFNDIEGNNILVEAPFPADFSKALEGFGWGEENL